MSDLWNYVKSLFKSAEASTPAAPTVHEMIERTSEERADRQAWQETLVRRRLTGWLADQYAIFLVAPDDVDTELDFLNTPSSKGFVIHLHRTRYSRRDLLHFLDYLKDQVRGLGYRVQISDRRVYPVKNGVETVERHYLKPRLKFDTPNQVQNQRYGNITISAVLRDDVPYQLKFQATSYQDRLFNEADDFRDLMQAVLA